MAKLGLTFKQEDFETLEESLSLQKEGYVSKYGYYKKFGELKILDIKNEIELEEENEMSKELALQKEFVCMAFRKDDGLCNLGFKGEPLGEYTLDENKINPDLIPNYPQWLSLEKYRKELFQSSKEQKLKDREESKKKAFKELDEKKSNEVFSSNFVKKDVNPSEPDKYNSLDFLPPEICIQIWLKSWGTKVGWAYYIKDKKEYVCEKIHKENPLESGGVNKNGLKFFTHAYLKSEFPEFVISKLSFSECRKMKANNLKDLLEPLFNEIRVLREESNVFVIGGEKINKDLENEIISPMEDKIIERKFDYIYFENGKNKWGKVDVSYKARYNTFVVFFIQYIRHENKANLSHEDLFDKITGEIFEDKIDLIKSKIKSSGGVLHDLENQIELLESNKTFAGQALLWARTNLSRKEWNKPKKSNSTKLEVYGNTIVIGRKEVTSDKAENYTKEDLFEKVSIYNDFCSSSFNKYGFDFNNIIEGSTLKETTLKGLLVAAEISGFVNNKKEFKMEKEKCYLFFNKKSGSIFLHKQEGILKDMLFCLLDLSINETMGFISSPQVFSKLKELNKEDDKQELFNYMKSLISASKKMNAKIKGLSESDVDIDTSVGKDVIKIVDISSYESLYENIDNIEYSNFKNGISIGVDKNVDNFTKIDTKVYEEPESMKKENFKEVEGNDLEEDVPVVSSIEVEENEVEKIDEYEEDEKEEEIFIDVKDKYFKENVFKNIEEKSFDMLIVNMPYILSDKRLTYFILNLDNILNLIKNSKSILVFSTEPKVLECIVNAFSEKNCAHTADIKNRYSYKEGELLKLSELNGAWICSGIPASKTRLKKNNLEVINEPLSVSKYNIKGNPTLRCLKLLIEELTEKGDTVLSINDYTGASARACSLSERYFTIVNDNDFNEEFISKRIDNELTDDIVVFNNSSGQGSLFS